MKKVMSIAAVALFAVAMTGCCGMKCNKPAGAAGACTCGNGCACTAPCTCAQPAADKSSM